MNTLRITLFLSLLVWSPAACTVAAADVDPLDDQELDAAESEVLIDQPIEASSTAPFPVRARCGGRDTCPAVHEICHLEGGALRCEHYTVCAPCGERAGARAPNAPRPETRDLPIKSAAPVQ